MSIEECIKIERQDNRLVGKFGMDISLGMFVSSEENMELLEEILKKDIKYEVIKFAAEILDEAAVKDKVTGFNICDNNYLENDDILVVVNKDRHIDMLKNAMRCGLLID